MPQSPVALTKSAHAYNEVRRRIVSGALPSGSVIPQAALAEELGVSTTPLREAMRLLAAEGLIDLASHKDARVSELTAAEAEHLYAVRERLDPLAAALAATERTEAEAEEIQRLLAQLEPLKDSADAAALEAHRDFHRAVYTASHNPLLVGILEGLWDKADRYRLVGLHARQDSGSDRARVRREHEAIARAVIDGDADAAEAHMHEHVLGSLGRRAIDVLHG